MTTNNSIIGKRGDLQGIIGNALPAVKILELPEGWGYTEQR